MKREIGAARGKIKRGKEKQKLADFFFFENFFLPHFTNKRTRVVFCVLFSSTSIFVPEYRDAPTRRYQFRVIARKIKWFKSGADRIKVKEPTNVGMKSFSSPSYRI